MIYHITHLLNHTIFFFTKNNFQEYTAEKGSEKEEEDSTYGKKENFTEQGKLVTSMKRRKDKILEASMLMEKNKIDIEKGKENENEVNFSNNKSIIVNMDENEINKSICYPKKDGKESINMILDGREIKEKKGQINISKSEVSDGIYKTDLYDKTENGEESEKERIKNVTLIINRKIIENEQNRKIKDLKDEEKLNYETRILSLQAQVENQSKSVSELRELTASLREGIYVRSVFYYSILILLPFHIY